MRMMVCGLLAAMLAGMCQPAAAQDPTDPIALSDGEGLRHGEFIWRPELAADGALRIDVDLTEQMAYVFRGDVLIGISTVSSGRDGHLTPKGRFPIIEKAVMHKSTLYLAAPMPYMQRLTMDGVALHAGVVPGHRSSHGCIHLPREFAEDLYGVTRRGDLVVVDTAAPVSDGVPIDLSPAQGPEDMAVVAVSLEAPRLPAAPGRRSRGWRRLLPTMLADR